MAALPQPWKVLSDRIYRIEESLKRLQNASPFFGTGVHANGNQGLDSDNFETGVSGFSLNGGTGDAEFNDIILRDLPNSMLASPVVPAVAHADATNFSLVNGPNVAKATATIIVPDGYTQAMVMATASMTAWNPNATSQEAYVAAWIQDDTSRGWSMPTTIQPSTQGATTHSATALLTGLSGSFTVQAAASSFPANWAASTSNYINIDATVLFLR